MAEATIVFEQQGGVAHLRLNNAAKHNALGATEIDLIESALANLDPATRVLLLSSNGGRTFCGGASLPELESGALTGDRFQAMTNHFAQLSVPSICVMNGNVFGGGFEMAMSCDFRIGMTDSMVRIPAAAIGLCYPVQGIERLVNRLGITLAKRMLVAAEEFSVETLFSHGVVNWLEAPERIMDKSYELAAEMAALAPLAVRAMLTIIRQAETGGIDHAKAAELASLCAHSTDLAEGLQAKRERRTPEFKGH